MLGWLDRGHARAVREADLADELDSRLADAASPALVLPLLRGDEAIELTAFTPDGKIVIQLPDASPRISVRHRGRQIDVTPVIHRILISTLEMGVYVVWHAAWYPISPLPVRASRTDATMATLLEGIEVDVDGARISALGEDST
jgi:hypothetical protein